MTTGLVIISFVSNKDHRYIFAVLMIGLASQVAQVLLLRELLMVFHGNELSIGLIFAAWLFWVGVGSQSGAILVERIKSTMALAAISSLGLVFVLPATLLLVRLLRGFFNLPPGAYLSLVDIALSCFLLIAPSCLILGAQFIFLAKIWRENRKNAAETVSGKVYAGEAAGNVLGGLLFTFLLVRYLNTFQAAFLVSLLLLTAFFNLIILQSNKKRLLQLRLLLLLPLLLFPFASPLFEAIESWGYLRQWENFSPHHELVETYQSKHGTIAVLKLEEQYSFFQSGHLIFSTAGPDTLSPGLEEQEAVIFAHLAMVQHRNPKSILLVGGGLRGLLAEITRYPVERIDYVELDETLLLAAMPYTSIPTAEALKDERVMLIHEDGRLFVKTTPRKYDLIIIDSPDPSTAVINRFYTREFFIETMDLLNPGGVLALGTTSTPDLRGRAIANRNTTIFHTLNSVYEYVLPAGEHFLYYFAGNDPDELSLNIETLRKRYSELKIETEAFSEYHFQTLLEQTAAERVNWVLRNHGRSDDAQLRGPASSPIIIPPLEEQLSTDKELPPVNKEYFINSDFKPIGYFYTLLFWDDLTRPAHGSMLEKLLGIEAWWIVPFFMLPILATPALRFGSKKKNIRPAAFAILFAVFCTGLSTMSLQIALLFSFQSIYGFIYEMVGLIIAFFMFGLSLGSHLTNRLVKHKANFNLLTIFQLLIVLLAIGTAFLLPPAAAVRSPGLLFTLFSLLTFSIGFINGVDFPVAAACHHILHKKIDSTLGRVYGIELFGACAGSILASVVIIPVLGIAAAFLFAAIANGSAFIILLLSGRVDLWLKKTFSRAG